MSTRQLQSNKFSLLVQSFLDMFPYPAWISDGETTVALNQMAKDISSQGLSLTNAKPEINYRGKKFTVKKSEMNHGTDCILHELHGDDEVTRRMKAVSEKMSKALNAS